jgi:glycosidase
LADSDPAVREAYPGFLFLAEAYWDLEWALQQQGFNYCYDKRLYDRILQGPAEQVRLHLLADDQYQHGLLRFVENHDEPRAVSAFGSARSRVAAVTALTQTGARLVHNGQLEGATVHLPVFLGRYPSEPTDPDLITFYRSFLTAVADPPSETVAGSSATDQVGLEMTGIKISSPGAGKATRAG